MDKKVAFQGLWKEVNLGIKDIYVGINYELIPVSCNMKQMLPITYR